MFSKAMGVRAAIRDDGPPPECVRDIDVIVEPTHTRTHELKPHIFVCRSRSIVQHAYLSCRRQQKSVRWWWCSGFFHHLFHVSSACGVCDCVCVFDQLLHGLLWMCDICVSKRVLQKLCGGATTPTTLVVAVR